MPNSPPRPTFLVAGAARSGTTALAEMLRAQPDVFVTDPKEPHFVAHPGRRLAFTGPGDSTTINRIAVTDRDAYLALYRGSEEAVARGDASVSTLYAGSRAVAAIQEHLGPVRIVVVLRDPVERAHSAHQYLRARGYEPEPDLGRALALEKERIAAGHHHMWHYEAMGRYGEQLAPFVEAFGEAVGVWFHDDLRSDPAGVLREVCAHIGSAGTVPPAVDASVNASGEARSRAVMALLRLPQRAPRLASLVRTVVPYGWWHRFRASNLRSTAVDPTVAAELRARYAPDLALLRELLDATRPTRPLPSWLDGS